MPEISEEQIDLAWVEPPRDEIERAFEEWMYSSIDDRYIGLVNGVIKDIVFYAFKAGYDLATKPRPIETAPKNKFQFVFLDAGYKIGKDSIYKQGRFNQILNEWIITDGSVIANPKHWLPFPQNPEGK